MDLAHEMRSVPRRASKGEGPDGPMRDLRSAELEAAEAAGVFMEASFQAKGVAKGQGER